MKLYYVAFLDNWHAFTSRDYMINGIRDKHHRMTATFEISAKNKDEAILKAKSEYYGN